MSPLSDPFVGGTHDPCGLETAAAAATPRRRDANDSQSTVMRMMIAVPWAIRRDRPTRASRSSSTDASLVVLPGPHLGSRVGVGWECRVRWVGGGARVGGASSLAVGASLEGVCEAVVWAAFGCGGSVVSAVVVSGAASGVVGSAAVAGVSVGAADGGQGSRRSGSQGWRGRRRRCAGAAVVGEATVGVAETRWAEGGDPEQEVKAACVRKGRGEVDGQKAGQFVRWRCGSRGDGSDSVTVDVADAAAAEQAASVVFLVAADTRSSEVRARGGMDSGMVVDRWPGTDGPEPGVWMRCGGAPIPDD